MPTLARAERASVARHPELPPYFHDRFEPITAERPAHGITRGSSRSPPPWRGVQMLRHAGRAIAPTVPAVGVVLAFARWPATAASQWRSDSWHCMSE
jgi:hypothetical protein